MHSRSADSGSVTAEFAAVIPAVVLVLVFALSSVQLAGQQVRLQDAAADAARILGRGDSSALAAEVVGRSTQGAVFAANPSGELICVRVSAPAASPAGALLGIELTATSCALDGGR